MTTDLKQVSEQSGYPIGAFLFVQAGLEFTVRRVHGEPEAGGDAKRYHVSGQQLCEGLRAYAIREYGLLARTVLRSFRIHTTRDFGEIVFAMIDAEMMQKTDEDEIEDFEGIFDFRDAFAVTPLTIGDARRL